MQQHIHIDEARVRAKAFELWQARGCPEGSGDQDWIEAERLLRAEFGAAAQRDGAPTGEDSEEPPVAVRMPPVEPVPPPAAEPRAKVVGATQQVEVEPLREPRPDELTVPSAGVVASASRPRDPRVGPAEAAPATLRGAGEVASRQGGVAATDRRAGPATPVSGGKPGKPASNSTRKANGKPDAKRKPGRGR